MYPEHQQRHQDHVDHINMYKAIKLLYDEITALLVGWTTSPSSAFISCVNLFCMKENFLSSSRYHSLLLFSHSPIFHHFNFFTIFLSDRRTRSAKHSFIWTRSPSKVIIISVQLATIRSNQSGMNAPQSGLVISNDGDYLPWKLFNERSLVPVIYFGIANNL